MEPKIGRILSGVGGRYTIRTGDGETLFLRARGAFRHAGKTPLVGDIVTVLPEADGSGMIREIFPRKNELIRPPMANLDFLFAVVAATNPAPSLLVLDKLLSVAEYYGISPVVVVTKSDLGGMTDDLVHIYTSAGFPVFVTGKHDTDGFFALEQFLHTTCAGKISCFAGASGVGKSTLVNRLFPHLAQAVGETSKKTERGKQTTRHVELFPISADNDTGYLADTPGFGMLDFVRFDFYELADLPHTFREFLPHLANCRYTDCTHTKEPDCGIYQALQSGEISAERHASFLAIYEELKAKPPRYTPKEK